MLGRFHLFEFNDQHWLPSFMTSWMTQVLNTGHEVSEDGVVWAEKVRELLEKSGHRSIVDLCSGGGGPVLQMARRLKENHGLEVEVTLTDLCPNPVTVRRVNQPGSHVTYVDRPVSATDVPNELVGVRTAFSGLHHLKPKTAYALLKNAFDNRQYIFLGETTVRSIRALELYAWAAFSLVDLSKRMETTPLQRFFTHRVPVLPAMLAWDNIVSCLRTYSPKELDVLVSTLHADDYRWEIGALCNKNLCTRYPYIMGYPLVAGQEASGTRVASCEGCR